MILKLLLLFTLSFNASAFMGGPKLMSRSSASQFDPRSISTLKLWLKADTGLLNNSDAAAANGDGIKTWQDQSGNSYHLSQSTAGLRPTLRTSPTTTFNGKPAVQFDGADDYLIRTTDQIQYNGGTTFMVWSPVDNAAHFNIPSSGGNANGQLFYENGEPTATSITMGMGAGANVNEGAYSYGTQYVTTLLFAAANSIHYRNGVEIGPANAGTNTSNGLSLGALRTGGEPAGMFLAEMLVYQGALSAANITLVQNYLKSKYGISF